MPHLPVPAAGRTHHPLRTHLLPAVHAALPVPQRPQLVQVPHLLRGRSRRRPEEVGPGQEEPRWRKEAATSLTTVSLLPPRQRRRHGDQAVCAW